MPLRTRNSRRFSFIAPPKCWPLARRLGPHPTTQSCTRKAKSRRNVMTTAAPGNRLALRRVVATLLLTFTVLGTLVTQSPETSGPTTRYARLYVFGDSYSDIGAGYIDGNGPTAVAYLGWLMGLQVASSST